MADDPIKRWREPGTYTVSRNAVVGKPRFRGHDFLRCNLRCEIQAKVAEKSTGFVDACLKAAHRNDAKWN